ncbi:MAG TPA: 4-hydroxy-tetrahydrodipicolinate reductase [Coriobacteriia bacterium]
MIRVAVAGAAGRMGLEVVRAVGAESDMEVVAAVDPRAAGTMFVDSHGDQVPYLPDLAAAIAERKPQVLVDFTHPTQVEANVRTALAAGVDCIVGTTGVTLERYRELAEGASPGTALFVAPNFAIGAVLMMKFAAEAARYMPTAEVVELHHDKKADAPSGTAMRTAQLIAEARSRVPDVPGKDTEVAAGARGAFVEGIPVHSVRLPGLVAHQEVLFGGQGQTLTIRHDSIDRTSFMPGVVLAVRKVGALSGLVVGLENILEG